MVVSGHGWRQPVPRDLPFPRNTLQCTLWRTGKTSQSTKKSGCKSSESVCTFEQKGSGILMIVSADAYFKKNLQTLIFKDANYVE